MRSSFRPHDRDRTTESMEGVWMGYWATLKGCWAARKRGLYGSPVNRWSMSDLQMERNLTCGLLVVYQGRLANHGPFRECLTPAHEKRQKGVPGDIGVPDCKTDNGENARMQETNTYAK